jgi:hypothetical protein
MDLAPRVALFLPHSVITRERGGLRRRLVYEISIRGGDMLIAVCRYMRKYWACAYWMWSDKPLWTVTSSSRVAHDLPTP